MDPPAPYAVTVQCDGHQRLLHPQAFMALQQVKGKRDLLLTLWLDEPCDSLDVLGGVGDVVRPD
ncbi:MAG: hypothetical protein AAFV53_13510 [Myxococcota bacterium]